MHPQMRHAHPTTVCTRSVLSGIQAHIYAHPLVSYAWEAGEVPIDLGARPAFGNVNKGDLEVGMCTGILEIRNLDLPLTRRHGRAYTMRLNYALLCFPWMYFVFSPYKKKLDNIKKPDLQPSQWPPCLARGELGFDLRKSPRTTCARKPDSTCMKYIQGA